MYSWVDPLIYISIFSSVGRNDRVEIIFDIMVVVSNANQLELHLGNSNNNMFILLVILLPYENWLSFLSHYFPREVHCISVDLYFSNLFLWHWLGIHPRALNTRKSFCHWAIASNIFFFLFSEKISPSFPSSF